MYAIIFANLLAFGIGLVLHAIVSKAADPKEQGLAMGSLSSMNSLLAVIAPLLGAPSPAQASHLPAGDWRIGAPFFMSAALSLLALVLAVAHFRRHRTQAVAHVAPLDARLGPWLRGYHSPGGAEGAAIRPDNMMTILR